jgi:hypothetical protein
MPFGVEVFMCITSLHSLIHSLIDSLCFSAVTMLTINTFHLPSVALSACSWSSFYFALRHLEPKRKAEWHCRLVTVTHAVIITIIAAYAAFVQGPWVFTDAGKSPRFSCSPNKLSTVMLVWREFLVFVLTLSLPKSQLCDS